MDFLRNPEGAAALHAFGVAINEFRKEHGKPPRNLPLMSAEETEAYVLRYALGQALDVYRMALSDVSYERCRYEHLVHGKLLKEAIDTDGIPHG